MTLHVIPAYGRDYKSKADIIADWAAGKDFRISDMSHPNDGAMVNVQDYPKGDLQVRYAALRKVTVIKATDKPKAPKAPKVKPAAVPEAPPDNMAQRLAKSYKAEMLVGSGWYSNALRFATAEEAKAYALNLFSRWTTPDDWRVALSDDAVNYTADEHGNTKSLEVSLPPECSICRGRHGLEISHACE